MKSHPAADLFPMMDAAALAELAEDVRENGLREPVRLLAGEVLDGRNRLAACEQAGVEPIFEDLPEDTDPVAYVVSLNVKRRNLSRDQRAIAAAEAWPLYEVAHRNQHTASALSGPERTRDRLAVLFGVGKNAVQQARAVVGEWPEAAAKIKTGTASLSGTYEVMQEELGRRESEAQRLEAEIERRRAELTAMAASPPDTEFLPPPIEERLSSPSTEDVERAVQRESPAGSRRKSDPKVDVWTRTLADVVQATKGVRALPDYPEDVDDLLRLAAIEQARHLADAATRLLALIPDQMQTVRRIK